MEEVITIPEEFLCGLKDCTDKFSSLEALKAHLKEVNNHKAPPVPGAGRPCTYCQDKEKKQTLADDYVNKHLKQTEKMTIPFVQELALLLDVDRGVIEDWVEKRTPEGELEHPEFAHTINKLKTSQELRLLQRTLGRYNATGAIFQLKTNHGYIETEKKVVTGDSNAPLLIELIPEKPRPDDE